MQWASPLSVYSHSLLLHVPVYPFQHLVRVFGSAPNNTCVTNTENHSCFRQLVKWQNDEGQTIPPLPLNWDKEAPVMLAWFLNLSRCYLVAQPANRKQDVSREQDVFKDKSSFAFAACCSRESVICFKCLLWFWTGSKLIRFYFRDGDGEVQFSLLLLSVLFARIALCCRWTSLWGEEERLWCWYPLFWHTKAEAYRTDSQVLWGSECWRWSQLTEPSRYSSELQLKRQLGREKDWGDKTKSLCLYFHPSPSQFCLKAALKVQQLKWLYL